jgi:peptide/nickel transport system permease protein/oligopeptide transport system permease protein
MASTAPAAIPDSPPPPAGALRAPRSALAVFLRNPAVRLSVAIIALVVIGAVAGPSFLPQAYERPTADQLAAPSGSHFFGTDLNGRDLLYRVFIGARISLIVGVSGALVSLFVGTTYGLVAGYRGGRTDAVMMRIVDVIYAIPRLIFIIILINVMEFRFRGWLQAVFGDSPIRGLRVLPGYAKTVILILSLGLVEWLTMARIVRGQVLALKNLQFVTAARSLGQTHAKIILRHLLPNITGIIAVYLTLTIPAVILDESFLSYLGLGVDASQASWGTLLSDGAQAINPIKSSWWLLVFPAAIMSATLLALNFLGDGLRDALDPRQK